MPRHSVIFYVERFVKTEFQSFFFSCGVGSELMALCWLGRCCSNLSHASSPVIPFLIVIKTRSLNDFPQVVCVI
jgi:hypothetical protein